MDDEAGWFFRDKVLLPGQGHEWMAHDHAVLTLVMSGRLDEGLAQEVQSCGALELHYKPLGLRHVTSTGPNGVRMLLLCVKDSTLQRLETPERDRPRVLAGGVRAARALTELLSIATSPRQRTQSPHHAMRNLWELLKDGPPRVEDRKRPGWISEAYERIVSEGTQRRSLARLADEFHIHPVYLARAFHAHYGLTIGSLRRRTRIDCAIARLRAGATSLSALASELGYSDQPHFTRAFKRETGWAPAAFQAAVSALARLDASGPA